MERNYMRPDALVDLDFITERSRNVHWHENMELLFVVSGRIDLVIEEEQYRLSSGDLALINVNHRHEYQGSEDLVLGRFLIAYNKVRELLGMDHVMFWCNSAADRNEMYAELQRVIARILNQSMSRDKRNRLYLNSMYYQMLHILAENFVLAPNADYQKRKAEKSDDRMQEIFAYIRNNYRQNISLDDIAQNLYLTTSYVSKYIKQKCGINFIELLNSVRLSHAMEDIMYSEDSIMKIALENGFASVSAFNKVFREAHHQTPSEFRKQRKNGSKHMKEEDVKRQDLIYEKVEQYLERNPAWHGEGREEQKLDIYVDMGSPTGEEWNPYACLMINAGTAADLLNANVQKQILDHREQMGFRYVRFWDIYDSELYLDIHSEEGRQNFSRIDAVTDFLVENQLKPYMELGFKGKRIIRSLSKAVRADARLDFFEDEREMEIFYRSLFGHFIKRYGSREVCQWYFEYWEKPMWSRGQNIALRYAELDEASHKEYFRQFHVIAGMLREQLPEAKIGGAGFPVRVYGEGDFTDMLLLWKQEEQKPDFLSLSCYPYMQENKNGIYYEKRLSDFNFVRYGIETAIAAMEAAGFPKVPVHVTEYSFSLSSRNVLNDSCLKAAYLISNGIDCIGKAELMGQFFYTDVIADASDSGRLLFGGNGFFTKDGIPKPSYYAMEFLNQLYPIIQLKHRSCLVTRNNRGSLRLVCHNLKKPNYKYYLMDEDALDMKDISSVLNDREFLRLRLKVQGVKDGTYTVKSHFLNSHYGSIQDKWIEMNMESDLTRKELSYLRSSSISHISIKEVISKDGCLELEMDLEPNEIRYVHISES